MADLISHLSYPNPTILEALCEIHFYLPEGIEWKPSLFGQMFKHIQEEFPEFEPVIQLGFQLNTSSDGFNQTTLPPQQRMMYKHASRKNLLLQLSPNALTINILPDDKYPGWQQMKQDILHAWKKVCGAISPEGITKIELRYINCIERCTPQESPGEWLAPNDYLPNAILSSQPGFLSRLITRPDKYKRLIVTLAELSNSPEYESDAIILDIDCIAEKKIDALNEPMISNEIDVLHDMAWCTFEASITPRLENLLKGNL